MDINELTLTSTQTNSTNPVFRDGQIGIETLTGIGNYLRHGQVQRSGEEEGRR